MASAISPTGSGGGLFFSSAITPATRSSIARQSCTLTRTSASAASIAAVISCRRVSSSMRAR